jgi:predicted kinase
MYYQTEAGQQEWAKMKKEQQEMIDSQDVQLQFVDDGTAHFEKAFVDHNVDASNDKGYL